MLLELFSRCALASGGRTGEIGITIEVKMSPIGVGGELRFRRVERMCSISVMLPAAAP